MNVTELFLLGRRLQKIAENAIPAEGVGDHPTSTHTVLIVAADIREHPGTTVTEISRRTGIVQSHISNCVARLRTAGAVVAAPDPADRRRTLLEPNPDLSPRATTVREASVTPALAAASTDVAETTALLERLLVLLKVSE